MARLTDGIKTVEITMNNWDGNGWTPDWSNDFFEVGGLEYDEETDTFKVQDVDYCVEQARDWEKGIGDYSDDDTSDIEDRNVDVTYIVDCAENK